MIWQDLPEWIQQTLMDLSRAGYIYIGRTGVGLSYAFRKGPHAIFELTPQSPNISDEGPLKECYKLGTIRALDVHMKDSQLYEKVLVETIAIEGPKWVSYERILELCNTLAVFSAAKKELT